MAKNAVVPRPKKKAEYDIIFGGSQAEKGWRDLKATIPNPLTDTWEFLTKTPTLVILGKNNTMRDDMAFVKVNGKSYRRWQHKPTTHGDARIWFYVIDKTVYLESVHTRHPNQTK